MIYYLYDPMNEAVKIGYAKHIINRLTSYYTHNINPLLLLKIEEGNLQTEKIKHNEYKDLNIITEWFRCDGNLKEKLMAECNYDFINLKDYSNYKELNKLTIDSYNLSTSFYEGLSDNVKRTMNKSSIKRRKKRLQNQVLESYNNLDNIFTRNNNNILPVADVKKHLVNNNMFGSSGKGILPVSKVAKHFNVQLKNVRFGKETKQCVVGLDYANK